MGRLDIDRILRETFVARAEHLPTVGSTNDRAAQCAAQDGGPLPWLIVADQQTAGRGRGGHRWWTGPGALAMSLLVDAHAVAADCGRSPLVALAAALAVVDTVAPLLQDGRVGIHWPNDVLAAGRKLSGILIEVLPDRRHIVGIGLNTNNSLLEAPAELRATAATLRDLTEREYDPTEILVDLLKRLEDEFVRLRRAPEAVAARVDAVCVERGRTVTLRHGDRTATGPCRGIAADGAIQLETPTGIEAFYSGSVSIIT